MLYPGEVIDQSHLEIIREAMSLGAIFRGLATDPDGDLVVTVVKAGKS
jgi:arginine/lysine/ornithine decarboxylase